MNNKQQIAKRLHGWLETHCEDRLQASERGAKGAQIDLGLGSGTTVWECIPLLASFASDWSAQHGVSPFRKVLVASIATHHLCTEHGIDSLLYGDEALEGSLLHTHVYIDGADEIDKTGKMIKGGGGAALQEKALAAQSDMFVCIAEERKRVNRLGKFGLPLMLEPKQKEKVCGEFRWLAQAQRRLTRSRELSQLAQAKRRWARSRLLQMAWSGPLRRASDATTDQGFLHYQLPTRFIGNPRQIEKKLDKVDGVAANGIFASERAELLITELEQVSL